MSKLLKYILWPALAGLTFALALLLAPALLKQLPILGIYQSQTGTATSTLQPSTKANAMPVASYSVAIKKAAPAVVSINSSSQVTSTVLRRVSPNSSLLWPFQKAEEVNSLGSGVIISPVGYVVTSYHVLFGNDTKKLLKDITVTLSDGRDLAGTAIALDEKNDLALLKIDAANLTYLNQTDDKNLEVGDVVLAIGNPRNIGQSVSFGIISALWRRDESFVIQTDAAINPGNSGGALIDADGNLVGINSSIVSESGGSEGISFAIPASQAIALLQEYLANSSTGGYLGVSATPFPAEQGLSQFKKEVQGFLITKVVINGPADKAGLKAQDVIVGVDGKKIIINDLTNREETSKGLALITNGKAGQSIVLEVFREDKTLEIPTTLGLGRINFSGVERIDDLGGNTNSAPHLSE